MAYTTPPTFTAGAILTAAQLNTYLRDNFKAIGDAWASFTPTWTSTGIAPALGNGTLTGKYLQVGKLVIFRWQLTMGSTSTYGTAEYRWALPVAAASPDDTIIGAAMCRDTGTALATRQAFVASSTTFGLISEGGVQVGQTSPHTWANTDVLSGECMYEAA